jgi:hypothetical protein
MKKNQFRSIVLVPMLFAGFTACATTRDDQILYESYSDRTEGVTKVAIKTPLVVANLDIDEDRFTTQIQGKELLSVRHLEKLVLAAAVRQSGADVVVAPQYEIVVRPSGYTAKITGFIGRYRAVRVAGHNDKILIKAAAGVSHGGSLKSAARQPKKSPVVRRPAREAKPKATKTAPRTVKRKPVRAKRKPAATRPKKNKRSKRRFKGMLE